METIKKFISNKKYLVAAIVCIIIAVLSFTVGAEHFSNPKTYAQSIKTLDEKQKNVLELTALTTASSVAITLIPGDTATPIAEKLSDFSTYFLVILCAIFLEKYMLTIIGFAVFKFLIPVGLILLVISFIFEKNAAFKAGIKIIIFGVLASLAVPTSVGISNFIEKTYDESYELAIEEVENSNKEIMEATGNEETQSAEESQSKTDDNESLWDKITGAVNDAKETVGETIENVTTLGSAKIEELTKSAENTLNKFIEATAVMLITSCVIPILVVVFYVWLLKVFMGAGSGNVFDSSKE